MLEMKMKNLLSYPSGPRSLSCFHLSQAIQLQTASLLATLHVHLKH